jgi:hypothetical protein
MILINYYYRTCHNCTWGDSLQFNGFHWSCEVDGIEVSRMNTLRVIAAN